MLNFKIYTSVNQIPNHWDDLPTKDVFLKTPFLKALEQSCPKNIHNNYVAIFKDEKLVGIAIIQRVEMYLDDIFRKTSDNALKRFAKALIAKIVRGNALIVGNLMHTGQHGFYIVKDEISEDAFLQTIFKVLDYLSAQISQQFDKKIRIVGFKDYFETDTINLHEAAFTANNFYKVKVQPNMMLHLPRDWENEDDYLANLQKKYKRRFKTARKKAKSIVKKELNLDEINTQSADLFKLYKHVSDQANVNSFILDNRHFFNLKKELKNQFKVFGYYLNQELMGFYTLILNHQDLETYFLGYDPKLQYQHQLYLNMLYDMLQFGIENQFKTVVYARTAMEIKSSVGAQPFDMFIYMKHTSKFILNPLLKFIVKTLNPVKKWEERHAFKTEL